MRAALWIGSSRYIEPEKDGVCPERIYKIIVPHHKPSNIRMIIYVSQGDSGSWYMGRHFHATDTGNGYYPYPKFSDKFKTKDEAIYAGIK